PVLNGEIKGIFASRNPNRPSGIGITTVRLIEIMGNKIHVKGLDALNGSPVLDIKPYNAFFTADELDVIRYNNLKANPRKEIITYIGEGELEKLLILAAQLHGHYCPGLALGVMAGTYGFNTINAESDGLEDLLVIVETNNCFSDGIQFVTGCSFGNNSLIFRDLGKMACSLVDRSGSGLRMIMRPGARDYMRSIYPEFTESYEKVIRNRDHRTESAEEFKALGMKKAFATLDLEFDRLFEAEPLKNTVIPEYAPVHESTICSVCGESTMVTRSVMKEDKPFCLTCGKERILQLTGWGISTFE
ncbi:MAG: SAM-dependent methyltransferase, partial [Bacteroidales bacterium]